MDNKIKNLNEDFNKLVNIKFDNILQGIDTYKNYILQPAINGDLKYKEEIYIRFIKECFQINKQKNKKSPLIIDFYLSKLNHDEYINLLSSIDNEDKFILEYLYENRTSNNYYYIFDEEILDFFVKLCTKELFFITFFFLGIETTIWGNYDYKFPIFFNDDNAVSVYRELSQKNKLLFL